ncbi:hypothetical protein FRB96_002081 [Tulasnella sp. 330]|nr:hypothetical protein FRB96_002081 [Tulasnella sp. 330]
MLNLLVNILIVWQVLFQSLAGGPTFELVQVGDRTLSFIVDPDHLHTPFWNKPCLTKPDNTVTISATPYSISDPCTAITPDTYVDSTGEWIGEPLLGEDSAVDESSDLAGAKPTAGGCSTSRVQAAPTHSFLRVPDVSPVHGIDIESKLIAENVAQLSFPTNVTNSSVVELIGPVATLDQLSSSLATRVLRNPVTFTSTCQRWAMVSSSRLISGVCIPLDATPRLTVPGFHRDCYDWRNIATPSTSLIAHTIFFQSSHRDRVKVIYRPVVFFFVLLVTFLSAVLVIHNTVLHLDSAIGSLQAIARAVADAVTATCETRLEGLRRRYTFKMTPRVTIALTHADDEDEMAAPRRPEDEQLEGKTRHTKRVGRRSRAVASLRNQRSTISATLDVERTKITRLRLENEHDVALIDLLKHYHVADLADQDYLTALATSANATSEAHLQKSRHDILSLTRGKTLLAASHADQEREWKAKLAVTKSELDSVLHNVAQLRAELLEKDDTIAALQSELEVLQRAHQDALDANQQLLFEKRTVQEGLQIELDLRLAAEKKMTCLIATHAEELENLRREVLEAERARVNDALTTATTVDQLHASNADLGVERSRLVHELGIARGDIRRLDFDLGLMAMQNARIVALEDMVRNLGGRVGCVETEVLNAACISEESYEDQMAYYDDPATSDESDDAATVSDVTLGDIVPCRHPEVASTQAQDVASDVVHALIAPTADIGTPATATRDKVGSLKESTSDATGGDLVEVAVAPVECMEAPRVRRFAGNHLLTSALKGIGAPRSGLNRA